MLNIKTKNRLSLFVTIFLVTILLTILILKSLEDNVMYFYSPTEIVENKEIELSTNIRIGGMVKNGSIKTIKASGASS